MLGMDWGGGVVMMMRRREKYDTVGVATRRLSHTHSTLVQEISESARSIKSGRSFISEAMGNRKRRVAWFGDGEGQPHDKSDNHRLFTQGVG